MADSLMNVKKITNYMMRHWPRVYDKPKGKRRTDQDNSQNCNRQQDDRAFPAKCKKRRCPGLGDAEKHNHLWGECMLNPNDNNYNHLLAKKYYGITMYLTWAAIYIMVKNSHKTLDTTVNSKEDVEAFTEAS